MLKTVLNYTLLVVVLFLFGIYERQQGWNEGFQRGRELEQFMHLLDTQQTFVKVVAPEITACESNNRPEAVGDGGRAYGVAQFHEQTFNWMRALAGKHNLSYKNEADQRWLLEWAIEHGYGNHWGRCYKRAVKKFAQKNLPVVVAEVGVPVNLVKWEVTF